MSKLKEIFEKYTAVVFFDTETTGLDSKTCQIIELAAIRIELTERDTLCVANSADVFIKLPKGEKLPEKIVELTKITDEILETEGISESDATAIFCDIISTAKGPVLLVAHNAQFDLLFIKELLQRNCFNGGEILEAPDYLDSLTVYKDRRAYPHKLENAIVAYGLQDKVKNSHRAIDDVKALCHVVVAMDNERADLLTYVNLFGYNPKYGVSGDRLKGVNYWPQGFKKFMTSPSFTLPAMYSKARHEGNTLW